MSSMPSGISQRSCILFSHWVLFHFSVSLPFMFTLLSPFSLVSQFPVCNTFLHLVHAKPPFLLCHHCSILPSIPPINSISILSPASSPQVSSNQTLSQPHFNDQPLGSGTDSWSVLSVWSLDARVYHSSPIASFRGSSHQFIQAQQVADELILNWKQYVTSYTCGYIIYSLTHSLISSKQKPVSKPGYNVSETVWLCFIPVWR